MSTKLSRQTLTAVLSLVVFLSFAKTTVKAEMSKADAEIILYPPLISQINFTPGDTFESSFVVRNTTAIPLEVRALKAEYNYQTRQITLPSASYAGCANWLILESSTIILPPESEKTVSFQVVIPTNAPLGAYVPLVYLQYNSAGAVKNEDITATEVEGSPSFKVELNVAGTTLPQIEIQTLKVNSPIVFDLPLVQFSITNTSQVSLRPLLRVQVISPSSERVLDMTFNESLAMLYPGQTISEQIELADFDLSSVKNMGQYRVELLAQDLQFGSAAIEKVEFFFLPVQVLLLIVVTAFAAGIGIYLLAKRRH